MSEATITIIQISLTVTLLSKLAQIFCSQRGGLFWENKWDVAAYCFAMIFASSLTVALLTLIWGAA